MTFDLIVKGGTLPDGRTADIAISGDRIAAVEPRIEAEAARVIDATGDLVSRRPSSIRISTWTRP
jgi:cytosine/creatinine deaminase